MSLPTIPFISPPLLRLSYYRDEVTEDHINHHVEYRGGERSPLQNTFLDFERDSKVAVHPWHNQEAVSVALD